MIKVIYEGKNKMLGWKGRFFKIFHKGNKRKRILHEKWLKFSTCKKEKTPIEECFRNVFSIGDIYGLRN